MFITSTSLPRSLGRWQMGILQGRADGRMGDLFSYWCLVGNEGMIHWLTMNNNPSNPQQPIHSLRLAPVSFVLMGLEIEPTVNGTSPVHHWKMMELDMDLTMFNSF